MNTLSYPRSISTIQLYIALFLIPFLYSTFAHYHGGYSYYRYKSVYRSSWLNSLHDETLLRDISMPGTHDSMSTGYGGHMAKNQSMSLMTQLLAGIRFIDIRCTRVKNDPTFYIYHEFVYLHATLDEVFETLISFLKSYPSETVIMRLKQERQLESNDAFVKNIEIALQPYEPHIWELNTPSTYYPTLRELRGKIIIARDFVPSEIGISYSSFFKIQDSCNLYSNWGLYDKWLKVKAHLYKANSGFVKQEKTRKPFVNYLSGSNGVFPYFVASGHSSPGTSAPRLATGLATPFFNSYPDFPRVNCFWFFWQFCTIAFEGTNVLTTDYINNTKPKYVGIIVADFPGPGLIQSIINTNRHSFKPGYIYPYEPLSR